MSTPITSSFHAGETAIQERLGIANIVEEQTKGFIRSAMPAQHREFFEQLPFIIIGAVDNHGAPWVMPIFAPQGFITSPDNTTLHIAQMPALTEALKLDIGPGQKMGLLGIELPTRRRNRMNGVIKAQSNDGFTIGVEQSFGNCPKYIQQRQITSTITHRHTIPTEAISPLTRLSNKAKQVIQAADTFFISSRTTAFSSDPRTGIDASHRGGKPGFVKVEEDKRLLFPDFSGNRFYNTLGNIEADGRVGVFFPDFISGDAVFITGTAKVIWDEQQIKTFEGAERLVEITCKDIIYVKQFLGVHSQLIEPSPFLSGTGIWNKSPSHYHRFTIDKKVTESNNITSFYLKAAQPNNLHTYHAGQFLPIKITHHGETFYRSYTLSQAPKDHTYRLSIKREDHGQVSRVLHDHYPVGSTLLAAAPMGDFILRNNDRNIVMLSTGVGITPMIAMLESLVNSPQHHQARHVYFIHGTQSPTTQAFSKALEQLEEKHSWLHLHTVYSQAIKDSNHPSNPISHGRITLDKLTALLPLDHYEFYLCGSEGFMRSMFNELNQVGLDGKGIDTRHIHYEFFGKGTIEKSIEKRTHKPQLQNSTAHLANNAHIVFSTSQKETQWTPNDGSLIELAEKNDLTPAYSCRSGSCGACSTALLSGDVHYPQQPDFTPEAGQVLICCAKPAKNSGTITLAM